jgi:hypothetical protein
MIAPVSADTSPSSVTPSMNERSTLRMSTGKRRIEVSEE